MSLTRSTLREATLRDERETTELTESTGPVPTEMAKPAVVSSLHEMGGNESPDIQHPKRLGSNVGAATGYPTKVFTVDTARGKPIWPFLTMPSMLGQIALHTARTVDVFHMQSIHIARHALNLVTLLNETVEEEEGPDDEQQDERTQLQSELMDLDDEMRKWGAEEGAVAQHDERVEEIRRQYDIFFSERFYHPDAWDYQFLAKVVAYDDRTNKRSTSDEAHAADTSSTSTSQQSPPAPPIGENFDLLVYILTRLRHKGVTSFEEYATYAERMGIIRLGGDSDGPGKQWMELVATD